MLEDTMKNENRVSDPSTWIDRHGDALFRYAMLRLNNSSAVEDIVQETFLAALKAREKFAGKSSERTWFVGILKNKIIDYIRKVSKETNFDEIDFISDDKESPFVRSGYMPGEWKKKYRPSKWSLDLSDNVEKKEFRKFLGYCLSNLPNKIAMIFMLREMEEESPEKICNDLNISPTNLRVIIYRARFQLRQCLEQNWIGNKEQTEK